MSKEADKARATEALALVTSRFTSREDQIAQAFSNDKGFQALCEDYCTCEQALEIWQASEEEVAPQRRQEYSELREELVQDIFEWLENPKP